MKNVRTVAIAFLIAVLRPAFGQITVPEQPIQGGLVALRSVQPGSSTSAGQPLVMLELAGTDSFGPKRTSLYSNAFFYWDPLNLKATAKVEVNDYVNSAHVRRAVGDGTTLWSYSFTGNTYTSFRYGAYSGPMPAGFRASMFDELTTATRGPSIFLARLLQETFAGDGGADYRTWLPGATATIISGGQSMADPVIPTRTYQSGPSDMFVVYSYGIRPKRSAAFHLVGNPTTLQWNLSEIYYSDLQQINPSTPRLIDWKITVYTGTLPASTNFQFVPPTTARGIANIKGQGG